MILHLPTKVYPNGLCQRSYDVISIFQDGGHRVENQLPALV